MCDQLIRNKSYLAESDKTLPICVSLSTSCTVIVSSKCRSCSVSWINKEDTLCMSMLCVSSIHTTRTSCLHTDTGQLDLRGHQNELAEVFLGRWCMVHEKIFLHTYTQIKYVPMYVCSALRLLSSWPPQGIFSRADVTRTHGRGQ